VLQFGKGGDNLFTLDFGFPLSLHQAFVLGEWPATGSGDVRAQQRLLSAS
jgi:hypothetical protein